MAQWQVQEAKQRFSEVLRRAHDDGPQIVTRHGQDIAVIIDIEEYRRLRGHEKSDFIDFLMAGPPFPDDIGVRRSDDLPREIDLED
jgi:antitoxin Phd